MQVLAYFLCKMLHFVLKKTTFVESINSIRLIFLKNLRRNYDAQDIMSVIRRRITAIKLFKTKNSNNMQQNDVIYNLGGRATKLQRC